MFSYASAGRSPGVGRDLKRGRPLAERADVSTAIGRAQRGAAREREGAFGNAVITADVRYFLVTKHYRPTGGGVKSSRNRQAAAESSGNGNSPFLFAFPSVSEYFR